MVLIDFAIKVFIFSSDAVSAMSQKWLLEAHQYDVKIISPDQDIPVSDMVCDDIFVLNFDGGRQACFSILDGLLNIPKRPKILILADESQGFGREDALIGGAAKIILKPQEPSDFLEAITALGQAKFHA